jgi:hypothetical protein
MAGVEQARTVNDPRLTSAGQRSGLQERRVFLDRLHLVGGAFAVLLRGRLLLFALIGLMAAGVRRGWAILLQARCDTARTECCDQQESQQEMGQPTIHQKVPSYEPFPFMVAAFPRNA